MNYSEKALNTLFNCFEKETSFDKVVIVDEDLIESLRIILPNLEYYKVNTLNEYVSEKAVYKNKIRYRLKTQKKKKIFKKISKLFKKFYNVFIEPHKIQRF